MEQNKKFSLSHVALYAKRWYVRSGDMWEDLKKMLELDDYTPFNKNDIFNIIVNRYYESIFNGNLASFFDDIDEHQCWKCGYFHKHSFFNDGQYDSVVYDYKEAIMYKILSDLQGTEMSKINIKRPVYNETNPIPDDITHEKVNEIFPLI